MKRNWKLNIVAFGKSPIDLIATKKGQKKTTKNVRQLKMVKRKLLLLLLYPWKILWQENVNKAAHCCARKTSRQI